MRGAVSIGRQAHPSLFTIPSYVRAKQHVSRPHPLHKTVSYTVRAISEATADPVAPKRGGEEQSSENWKIKMLYDGECPLCMREVNTLRERNNQYGSIKFVDISSDEYSPQENRGLDYKTAMGKNSCNLI